MFSHWRYVLDNAVRPGARGLRARRDAHPRARGTSRASAYAATADDAAYAIFELDGGAIAQINSSWCVRVDRDELVEFQVDGTDGSAVAGLRDCRVQHRRGDAAAGLEPGPAGDPSDFRAQWAEVPDNEEFDNGFKVQWEVFLRHVARRRAVPVGLPRQGAQGRAAGRARAAVVPRRGGGVEVPEL